MARPKILLPGLLAMALGACSAATPDAPAGAASPNPAKGYILAEIAVTSPEPYKVYLAAVTPMIEAFGGKYIVRAGRTETPEGAEPAGRMVVLEFASFEAARAFYHSPEYQQILSLRTDNATSRINILEGYAP
jgi:uncharacterized protein (DUF1330 family)